MSFEVLNLLSEKLGDGWWVVGWVVASWVVSTEINDQMEPIKNVEIHWIELYHPLSINLSRTFLSLNLMTLWDPQ